MVNVSVRFVERFESMAYEKIGRTFSDDGVGAMVFANVHRNQVLDFLPSWHEHRRILVENRQEFFGWWRRRCGFCKGP